MMVRSFRLEPAALADLATIAAHLSKDRKRAPNQTKALAWAIARGVDAVARIERLGEEIPDSLRGQLLLATQMLERLVKDWRFAGHSASRSEEARAAIEAENAALRERVREYKLEVGRRVNHMCRLTAAHPCLVLRKCYTRAYT